MDQGAFLAALTAKGPTVDELAEVWRSIMERDTNKVFFDANLQVLDMSVSGWMQTWMWWLHRSGALASACSTGQVR
jgi:anthranilate phosphoribosyltransferase